MTSAPAQKVEALVRVTCWQCAGEGRIAGTCIDGCCEEQDDPDCELCSHRCDICKGAGSYSVPASEADPNDLIG